LQGIETFEQLRLKAHLVSCYFILGELYASTGKKEKALENLKKAEAMCLEMDMGYWPDKIQEVLARL